MRLKCVKLSGFKSFVDLTVVHFPSNICAVVGPNGCGKSNVIDAVRWVMGESSAKNLRGEAMTDVIFKGSSQRKPVSQAFVELIFDNSDHSLSGAYAAYTELSVKRLVNREAQSTYFLNGTKCRRRDVMDLFLGTGLGPRSYAIVSQGTVSNLVESKPEELRVFIEEAAGISKYKERRRETESRIRRTRDNLERLTDIRDELANRLARLQQQARTAEHYQQLKAQERRTQAQCLAIKWRHADEQYQIHHTRIVELEQTQEDQQIQQGVIDSTLAEHKTQQQQVMDEHNQIQAHFYALGNTLSSLEQQIKHQKERHHERIIERERIHTQWEQARDTAAIDQAQYDRVQEQLQILEPELQRLEAIQVEGNEQLTHSEQQYRNWQKQWDEAQSDKHQARQSAEVEQAKIRHSDQRTEDMRTRQHRLIAEQQQLEQEDDAAPLALWQDEQAMLMAQIDEFKAQKSSLNERIEAHKIRMQQGSQSLEAVRKTLHIQSGQYASLEALQDHALGKKNTALTTWLEHHQWAQYPRFMEQIQVDSGWEKAVDVVLGARLQALCTERLDHLADTLTQAPERLHLFAPVMGPCATPPPPNRLFHKVRSALDLRDPLAQVYAADSIEHAFAMREHLQLGESVITQEGIWLSSHWLQAGESPDAATGLAARQQAIHALDEQMDQAQQQIATQQQQQATDQQQLVQLEREKEAQNSALLEAERHYHQIEAKLQAQTQQQQQRSKRLTQLTDEHQELHQQSDLEQTHLADARMELAAAIEAMAEAELIIEQLQGERDRLQQQIEAYRMQTKQQHEQCHQQALQYQKLITQSTSLQQGLARLHEQMASLSARKHQLQEESTHQDTPIETLEADLQSNLSERVTVEQRLKAHQEQLKQIQANLNETERQQVLCISRLQDTQKQREHLGLEQQKSQVLRQTFAEQLKASEHDLAVILEHLPDTADPLAFEQALEALVEKIRQLGAVNLAAVDEYQQQQQRKQHLDVHNDDLLKALDTLEAAIKRIDQATRTQFQTTFETLNERLQALFPKIFGGGQAYLERLDDDWLSSGVRLMAQPPGKKNSTIHLLSGGEKALTAIALVFAIFQLNPAPFCMLDEVDAPLDDANVLRYSRLVAQMSEQTQFIYITHNKIAMEAAHQLIGVTMHEPGVSRPVSVDVKEAAKFVQM